MLRIIFGLVVISLVYLTILHRVSPHDPLVAWLFIEKQAGLEIELIGSGILASIIGLLLFSFQEDVRKSQNKERSKRFFEKIVLKSITNAFDRSLSTLNISTPMNHKAYYDNSNINNLYDTIEKYLDSILEFIDYHNKNEPAKKLIEFYDSTEEGYRRGEELDILLNKMSKITHIDQETVIYLKGLRYAQFENEELKVLLADPSGKNNLHDFFDRYYLNPENDLKLRYKNNFVKLDVQMKDRIKKLIQKCDEIRKIV